MYIIHAATLTVDLQQDRSSPTTKPLDLSSPSCEAALCREGE
jgi:hypothetical protein